MSKIIHIHIEGSKATYEVSHEIDGIYKATIVNNGFRKNYNFPNELILVRIEDKWTSDHHFKELGMKIGEQIDEHEKKA